MCVGKRAKLTLVLVIRQNPVDGTGAAAARHLDFPLEHIVPGLVDRELRRGDFGGHGGGSGVFGCAGGRGGCGAGGDLVLTSGKTTTMKEAKKWKRTEMDVDEDG